MKTNINMYRGERYPRDYRHLRDHQKVVPEVRTRVCKKARASTGAAGRKVAPGRSHREDQGRAALFVADRGPGRGLDRHPGSAVSQRPRGQAVLSQAAEGQGRGPSRLVTD